MVPKIRVKFKQKLDVHFAGPLQGPTLATHKTLVNHKPLKSELQLNTRGWGNATKANVLHAQPRNYTVSHPTANGL